MYIPHIIGDMEKAKKHIKVRQGDIHSHAVPLVPLKRKSDDSNDKSLTKRKGSTDCDSSFDVDERHVIIRTKKQGSFIVTSEGLNCCSKSAICFLFGSMKYFPDHKSLATIKAYFWSVLGRIKDYKTVSFLLLLHYV